MPSSKIPRGSAGEQLEMCFSFILLLRFHILTKSWIMFLLSQVAAVSAESHPTRALLMPPAVPSDDGTTGNVQ